MSKQLNHFYEFGPFRVDASERLLLRNGEHVPLTPKAFDLLLVLVENCGHVLSKEELMKRLWPDSFVEEANLSNNIYKLREVLGEGHNEEKFVETLPRRGYRFVAKVIEGHEEECADILVEEQTIARIVVEEELETSHTPTLEVVEVEANPSATQQTHFSRTNAAVRESWFTRHLKGLALLTAGMILSGLAFSVYAFFHRPAHATDKPAMKITRLTNVGVVGDATISPDGKFISYSQNYMDGVGGCLWVKQPEANTEVLVLPCAERIFGGKSFSPDGSSIYYVSYEKSDPEGALYQIPVLGGPPNKLLEHFGSMFSLSPDGKRVAFYRDDLDHKRSRLMIAALDGSGEQALVTRDYTELSFKGSPAWKPDGNLIAFAANTAPMLDRQDTHTTVLGIDLKNQTVKPLTAEQWLWIGHMVWTGDGQGLIFAAGRPHLESQLYYLSYPAGDVRRVTNDINKYGDYGLGVTVDSSALVVDQWETSSQLWTVEADGKPEHTTRLTTGYEDGSRGVASLPDGHVAYVAKVGDSVDLWMMKEDGTEVKALTADTDEEWHLTATPDGRYLVFTSDRAGHRHVFRLNVDGSDLKQLTRGESYDKSPDCSPDGNWVTYASTVGGKTTIWKVSIDGAKPVQLTDYEAFTPRFSPGGDLIACEIPAANRIDEGQLAVIPAQGGAPIKTFDLVHYTHQDSNIHWTPDGQALITSATQKGISNLWEQPLAGGPPRQLTDYRSDVIYNFAFSRDGKRILISRGQFIVNVLLIRDFR